MFRSSAFPVAQLALESVARVSLLLDRLAADRGTPLSDRLPLDRARVAASFGSERLVRVDGAAPDVWAPLSGFFRASDGWVRTHGNYPHHAERLRVALGLTADANASAMADTIARRSRFEIEDAAARAGAVAAAVRSEGEWRQHSHSAAIAALPLIGHRKLGDADPRRWRGHGAPLVGIRVLDLTRVIAGPVATRDLALAGAEVLRVDDPHRPEIPWQHLDTGQLKRTTLLDLSAPAGRRSFDALLADADVVVTGYRPGALSRFGLDSDSLARTHPGIVVAGVSAWGNTGPWARRRGFDSIVQAATGIAIAEQEHAASDEPGTLPVQALDHASGHLLAAGIVAALRTQRTEGGSHAVSVVLARTAEELLGGHDGTAGDEPTNPAPPVTVPIEGGGTLECAPPPLAFAGAPRDYRAVHRWGADPAEWAIGPEGR